MIEAEAGVVAREITIDAPPELVFSYFTDPVKHVLWQGVDAELDPRPGGIFRVKFAPGYVASGTYLEIDQPRRLVYTWGWEDEGFSVLPPGASTVEVTLESAGAGTVVRVRHSGLPEGAMVEFHGQGWDDTLAELERRVTTEEEP